MGAKLTFQIASKLEEAGFSKAADHLRKMDTLQGQASESAEAYKEAVGGLKNELLGFASVVGVIAFFKSMVDEAAQGQETMDLLGSKVESTGQDFGRHKTQVEAFTTALSEQTRFSQTEYVRALGNAIDKVRDLGTAEQLMGVAAGFAVGKHLELSQATDLVAGVTMHQSRATMEAVKIMGLSKGMVHDYEGVLRIMQERYGKLAMDETNYTAESKKLSNQFGNMKEILGSSLLPVVTLVSRTFLSLFSIVVWGTKMVADLVIGIVRASAVLLDFVTDLKHPMQAFGRAKETMKAIGEDFVYDSQKSGDELSKIWGENGALVNALAKQKAVLAPMLEETAAMLQRFKDQTSASMLIGDDKKLELMRVQFDQEMALVRKHLEEIGESDSNIKKVQLEAEKSFQMKLMSESLALTKARFDRTYGIALHGFESMGSVAAKFLRGDKSAWAEFSKLAISTTVQTAQAMILANAAAAASQALLIPIVGEAKAASILAWGAGEAAFVGALGGFASELIGGAGGSSPSATGGGFSGGGGSGVASAPAASSQPGMSLTIVIDQMVGDPAYVDSLVQKISDRVERNDMRLVATSVKS